MEAKRKINLEEIERLLEHPEWEKEFTDRELKEINFCNEYALDFRHGTDGHNRMMIIAKMTVLLDMMEVDKDSANIIISIGKVKDGIEVENKIVGNTLYLKNGTFISFPGSAWIAKEIFENLKEKENETHRSF